MFVFLLSNTQIQAMEAVTAKNDRKIELRGLSGQKLKRFCQSILDNEDIRSQFDNTLIAHIAVDKERVMGLYFCVAADLREITHRTTAIEEKKRVWQYSAEYLIKSLMLGNTTARVALVCGYPKVKTLLDNWGPELSSLDEARFTLLVKIAHDYWVYHKKS